MDACKPISSSIAAIFCKAFSWLIFEGEGRHKGEQCDWVRAGSTQQKRTQVRGVERFRRRSGQDHILRRGTEAEPPLYQVTRMAYTWWVARNPHNSAVNKIVVLIKRGGALEATDGRSRGDHRQPPDSHPAHTHESGRTAGQYRGVSISWQAVFVVIFDPSNSLQKPNTATDFWEGNETHPNSQPRQQQHHQQSGAGGPQKKRHRSGRNRAAQQQVKLATEEHQPPNHGQSSDKWNGFKLTKHAYTIINS